MTFQMTVFINANAFGPKPNFLTHIIFKFSMCQNVRILEAKQNYAVYDKSMAWHPYKTNLIVCVKNNWESHTTPSLVPYRLPTGSPIGCTMPYSMLMYFAYNIHDRMYNVCTDTIYIYIHTRYKLNIYIYIYTRYFFIYIIQFNTHYYTLYEYTIHNIFAVYIYMVPPWNLPFWHIHQMAGSKGGYLTYTLRVLWYIYIYIYILIV